LPSGTESPPSRSSPTPQRPSRATQLTETITPGLAGIRRTGTGGNGAGAAVALVEADVDHRVSVSAAVWQPFDALLAAGTGDLLVVPVDGEAGDAEALARAGLPVTVGLDRADELHAVLGCPGNEEFGTGVAGVFDALAVPLGLPLHGSFPQGDRNTADRGV